MKRLNSAVLTLSIIFGLALAGQSAFAVAIFVDDFSSSTLNSLIPSAPTATSTAYQYLSGKADNPIPSIATDHLIYGIVATASGVAEVQALFASSPVSVANIGDSLTLHVVFTDTAGILTVNSLFGIGMYNSGGAGPLPGGLDYDLGGSDHPTGYAQNWLGYVGQLAYSGQSSRIMNRLAQEGTANNNQDVVTSDSGSQSYRSPPAVTVGGSGITSTLSLTEGAQYTAVLSYTMIVSGLVIQNDLYNSGNTLLSSSVTSPQATPVATSFVALGIGWIMRANVATTIDINSIRVDAVTSVPEPASMALVGLTLGMVLAYRRSRR